MKLIMGTHYKGNKKEINALNTYIKLIRAAESVRTRINELIIKKGLTESQFNALDALYHLGSLNQKELGDKLFRTGGNITLVIDNLEKQKLVKRERGEDRRCFTLHMTNKGMSLFESIFPEELKLIIEETNLLNEKEQAQLQKFCKILGLKKRD
ncbi:MAG TPA: MarR family transcriptional regulator [Ignavibacteriaceae bacterium]|nr:MarR family transcriptional regulator [Ignavibacteriaceae bacterium]